jgi:hypothetical protein
MKPCILKAIPTVSLMQIPGYLLNNLRGENITELAVKGTIKGKKEYSDHQVLLIIALIIIFVPPSILWIVFHLQAEGRFIGGHPNATKRPACPRHIEKDVGNGVLTICQF